MGSLLFVRFSKVKSGPGDNKIKNACAKLIIMINKTTKKEIICFPTLMIIAKYTPKYSNTLKNNKNFISKNKHEKESN